MTRKAKPKPKQKPKRRPRTRVTHKVAPSLERRLPTSTRTPFLDDHGVPMVRRDGEHLVALANPLTAAHDARRPEVRVGGRVYTHVGEDPSGRWIYRLS